jgi:hypothetical protein
LPSHQSGDSTNGGSVPYFAIMRRLARVGLLWVYTQRNLQFDVRSTTSFDGCLTSPLRRWTDLTLNEASL